MKPAVLAVTTGCLLAVTACGSGQATQAAGPGGDRLAVSASFYPLEWAAQRIGGDRVEVTGLTKPGGEPHDLELTPQAVGGLASAEVVVYLGGFQPAVDDAVDARAGDAGFDVAPEADLSLTTLDDGHDHSGESEAEHQEHAEEAGAMDPHFWLDPLRFAAVATAIGERFAAVDPDHADQYRADAAALVGDLEALDADFSAGLADCQTTELVTGHTAFAYLADRYGLTQTGISGVSADSEPDAASIRELAERVEQSGASTVYGETLVDPALAETVARESGAAVAVLDPIEGLTDSSAGEDYLEVMRSNLATLRGGQRCS